MSKLAFGSSLPLFGYALFLAAVFLFVRGYQFDTDDQAEHLPQIYQLLDPQLYPNDYFVNASNSVFTVRFYYEKVVLFVAETVGLEWGLFFLTFCCIALMAYSFSRMAEKWFNDRWAVLLAPFLSLIVFYYFTVGGNNVMYSSFISSTAAKSISAFALLQFISDRKLLAGLILGAATLFQPLVGLQLFLILGGLELLVRRDFGNTVKFAIPYIALAALILVPTFQRQFGEATDFDKELYYTIFYRFRNHHHFLPSLFPITHYIKFGGLLVLGLVSYFVVRPRDNRFYLSLVVLSVLGMVVYAIGLEGLDIYSFGKTQWFKTTVWVGAFSSIMVAGLIGQLLSGFSSITRVHKYLFPFSFSLFILLILAITNSKYLPERYQHKYMVGNRAYTDLEKMHFWIAENTPKDISVLVSPDDNAFACQAKRSMPIHFQAIVHEPFFMLPWYEDYKEIYGVSIENLEGIDARAHAVKLYGTRNYRGTEKHIDYRLDDLKTCAFSDELGPVLHQEGDWVLTEFLPVAN